MSYEYNGGSDNMIGQLTTGLIYPITFISAVKYTIHPVATRWIMGLGGVNNALENCLTMRLGAVDDQFTATAYDSGGVADTAQADPFNFDGVWFRILTEYISDTSRSVYVGAVGNTASNIQSSIVTAVLSHIRFGDSFTGSTDLSNGTLLAELAIWNAQLTTPEKTSALAGAIPTSIQSSLCRGYWPCDASNSTQANQGQDTGGDLTVSGATFNADHPTVTSPGGLVLPFSGKLGGLFRGKFG